MSAAHVAAARLHLREALDNFGGDSAHAPWLVRAIEAVDEVRSQFDSDDEPDTVTVVTREGEIALFEPTADGTLVADRCDGGMFTVTWDDARGTLVARDRRYRHQDDLLAATCYDRAADVPRELAGLLMAARREQAQPQVDEVDDARRDALAEARGPVEHGEVTW